MRRVAIGLAVALAIVALADCKKESPPPNEGSVAGPPPGPIKDLTPKKDHGPAFALAVNAPPAEHGKPVVATVAVTPSAGYHVNTEYPTSLSFTDAPGITTAHATQSAKEATHYDRHQLAFGVELTCADAGPHKLTGELKFAVCTDDGNGCMPQTAPVEVAVDVR